MGGGACVSGGRGCGGGGVGGGGVQGEASHLLLRHLAELVHHIVGVVGVADGVGAAQQHLEGHVGHQLAHLLETLPRALAQEAQPRRLLLANLEN